MRIPTALTALALLAACQPDPAFHSSAVTPAEAKRAAFACANATPDLSGAESTFRAERFVDAGQTGLPTPGTVLEGPQGTVVALTRDGAHSSCTLSHAGMTRIEAETLALRWRERFNADRFEDMGAKRPEGSLAAWRTSGRSNWEIIQVEVTGRWVTSRPAARLVWTRLR